MDAPENNIASIDHDDCLKSFVEMISLLVRRYRLSWGSTCYTSLKFKFFKQSTLTEKSGDATIDYGHYFGSSAINRLVLPIIKMVILGPEEF